MADEAPPLRDSPLLQAALNLSQFHREHEKHYSAAPFEDARWLQRTSRTLKALAERWSRAEVERHPAPSPFAGAPDLNDDARSSPRACCSWKAKANREKSRASSAA